MSHISTMMCQVDQHLLPTHVLDKQRPNVSTAVLLRTTNVLFVMDIRHQHRQTTTEMPSDRNTNRHWRIRRRYCNFLLIKMRPSSLPHQTKKPIGGARLSLHSRASVDWKATPPPRCRLSRDKYLKQRAATRVSRGTQPSRYVSSLRRTVQLLQCNHQCLRPQTTVTLRLHTQSAP